MEGLRLFDELLATHTVMRRGTTLMVAALGQLSEGAPVSSDAVAALTQWQSDFIRQHNRTIGELVHPLMHQLFPVESSAMDTLLHNRMPLDIAVSSLTEASARLGAAAELDGSVGRALVATLEAVPAANAVAVLLGPHLDREETLLGEFFDRAPAASLPALRRAVMAGTPNTGADLMLGLLEDPGPATGREAFLARLPAAIRDQRALLLRRYQVRKTTLVP